MQTIGEPAPSREADRSRPILAIVVVATAFVLAAIGLTLARGDALPADQGRWTPLQMAERFNELYENGRVEEFQALLSPDARWCHDESCDSTTPFFGSVYLHENQTSLESQYLAATGGTLGADCAADGDEVTCLWHQSNLFFEVGDIDPWVGPQSFTVEDGLITRYSGGYRYEGVLVYDRVQQNQYSEWVERNYSGEHGTLFEDQLMLVFTEEARERHRQLTSAWASTFGG
jgi:hypothetical protein